ncbi:MAG: cyclic nucleotide-binding domain-containing protein [Spirochaetales bacterium]|nr:cyclic nucleotide-binding domain-containing protein [Spirochaetales bacterium]
MEDIFKERDKDINRDEVQAIISKISIFGALSKEQIQTLLDKMEKFYFVEGERIFKQGDPPSNIYVVKSGSVDIRLEKDGDVFFLANLDVGECFGETSVIGIQGHSASAYAKEDTELIILSRQALFGFYEEDPKLFGMVLLNIAREACRRLNRADMLLSESYKKNGKNE